jgi:hypothetical protein
MQIDLHTIYKELKEVKRMLRESGRQESPPLLINEEEACSLLGICSKTLSNYISNGTIPESMIVRGVGRKKFFDKEKLIGVKK